MSSNTKRLVVLMSGTGATLQGVVDATRWRTLDAQVVAAISHEPWSYGLLRAEREHIPAILHDLAEYRLEGKNEREYLLDLAQKVGTYNPDLVVLAEWRLPLNEEFFQRFPNQVINLHPGLPGEPPVFDPYGRSPVSRTFEAYNAGLIREAQVSVQFLNGTDSIGRVVAQERIPIYEFDTMVDLEDRMNRIQQELLVNTLRLLLRENEQTGEDSWMVN